MIDLRDAFHTLRLALSCMSVSLQIWQQFVDLVFQDDLIKHKQNFDVIIYIYIYLYIQEQRNIWMILWTYLRF